MKKRTSTKRPVRRPRRRRITATEEQQITQMMRKAGAYAFSDRLAELKKDYGVDPKRAREILVSPFTVLGPWYDLEKQLREAQEELPHTVGPAQEGCQARIDQIEAERAAAAGAARLGYKQRFGRRKKAPSPTFWYNAPVSIPDEPWLNPNDWSWLRERAARLADYLRTTRLPNRKRPWRIATARDTSGKSVGRIGTGRLSDPVLEVTAELVQLFYRMGYFPRLEFSADDAKMAVKTFLPVGE
jgi:hypothetical protein